MTLYCPVPLGEVHSELSCILFAVQTGLQDLGVTVEVNYNQFTYLGVTVDIWPHPDVKEVKRKITAVVARLQRGIIHDEYDYRFRSVAYPPLDADLTSWEKYEVSAALDMHHWPHRKPHGWDPLRPNVDPIEQSLRGGCHRLPPTAGLSPV